jgi:hypothetical protein
MSYPGRVGKTKHGAVDEKAVRSEQSARIANGDGHAAFHHELWGRLAPRWLQGDLLRNP